MLPENQEQYKGLEQMLIDLIKEKIQTLPDLERGSIKVIRLSPSLREDKSIAEQIAEDIKNDRMSDLLEADLRFIKNYFSSVQGEINKSAQTYTKLVNLGNLSGLASVVPQVTVAFTEMVNKARQKGLGAKLTLAATFFDIHASISPHIDSLTLLESKYGEVQKANENCIEQLMVAKRELDERRLNLQHQQERISMQQLALARAQSSNIKQRISTALEKDQDLLHRRQGQLTKAEANHGQVNTQVALELRKLQKDIFEIKEQYDNAFNSIMAQLLIAPVSAVTVEKFAIDRYFSRVKEPDFSEVQDRMIAAHVDALFQALCAKFQQGQSVNSVYASHSKIERSITSQALDDSSSKLYRDESQYWVEQIRKGGHLMHKFCSLEQDQIDIPLFLERLSARFEGQALGSEESSNFKKVASILALEFKAISKFWRLVHP